MTIPRLNGTWDEIGESVKSLAQTITRSIDPHFDNKLALSQMLREDPTKQQALLDLDLNNPGLLEGLYGKDVTNKLRGMGGASAAAKVEKTKRNLVDKPVGEVGDTVGEEAALAEMGVDNALKRNIKNAELDATRQQTDYYSSKLFQDNYIFELTKGKYAEQYKADQQARAMYPDLAMLDPYQMAMRHFQGTLDVNELHALADKSKEGTEMFWRAYNTLVQTAQDDKQIKARQNEIRQQNAREDNKELRAAKEFAAKFITRGLPFQDLVNYYMTGETSNPMLTKIFERDETMRNAAAVGKNLKAVQDFMKEFKNAEPSNRPAIQTQLEGALYTVFNAPVKIVKTGNDDTWAPWDKSYKYQLDGIMGEVDGEMLFELANNRELFDDMQADYTYIQAMSPDQIETRLKQLEASKATINPYQYKKAVEALKARLNVKQPMDRKTRSR